jgi:hypothetical protein
VLVFGRPPDHQVATSGSSGSDTSTTLRPSGSGTPGTAVAATSGSSGSTHSTVSPGSAFTISAVGDTMLGDTPDLPPNPGGYFSYVDSELTSGAQIVFGNLEGTLTTATSSKCGASATDCYAFRVPPSYASYLHAAGFTILNDANNHSYDFGAAGQAQTVSSIHAAAMAQTGLPGEITVVHANGTRVAFVAFAPYFYDANLLDLQAGRALIERAASGGGVVVVYMHAGAEGASEDHVTGQEEYLDGEDRGNAEAFAHMAVDAGADLVIASGPHVVRGMQFYKGHLIAYSLGNFAGYNNFATYGVLGETVILHVTLAPDGRFLSGHLYPVTLDGPGQPVPGGAAPQLMATLSQEDFGSSAAVISAAGAVTAPAG